MTEIAAFRSLLEPIPAFTGTALPTDLREQMTKAVKAWKLRTPSPHTRRAYQSDLDQFLTHAGIEADAWEQLAASSPRARRRLAGRPDRQRTDQQLHPPQDDRPAVAVLLPQDLRLHRGQPRP